MKEVSRDFAHKTSPWRKAIAVITATALVASMSNIQAFGASEEKETPAVDQTVTVRFEVDEGVMVRVAGQPISADDPTITATTAYDLSFSVEPTVSDTASYTVGAVEYTFGNVKEEVVSPADPIMPDENEEGMPGDATGEEPDVSQSESSDDAVDGSIPDPTVVPEEDPTPDVNDGATVGDIDNAIEPSEEVTLSDDVTPMADSPESAEVEETPAVFDNGVIEADEGVYRLTKETLAAAAEQNKEVVVRVSSELTEEKVTASDWDMLKAYLEKPGNDHFISIKLENSIEALEAVAVVGKKNIELNGNTISTADGFKDKHLFVVGEGARLTLTDAASKGVAPQSQQIEKTTSSDKYADKDIAKLGTYNADTQELVYYVSTSRPDRKTGTSQEERVEMKLNMSTTGAVLGTNLTSLVKVENGIFDMSGGRLTNTGGDHGIEVNGMSRVQITGGFIVGNGPGNEGAGIWFKGNDKESSSLVLGGTSVVGGNVVDKADVADEAEAATNNGGGVWVSNCSLTLTDDAVVASNYAGNSEFVANGAKGQAGFSDGSHYGKYNGGGVYVELNTSITLEGNAIIASNRAASDGGGIYVKPTPTMIDGKDITSPTNTLKMREKASVSNNKAMRDMSAWNPKDKRATPDSGWWHIYTGGGGGIFSMGNTFIESAQVVNNFASDGGGGILLPGEGAKSEVKPEIFADYVVVAGNYCDGSEGGGIHCQPKATENKGEVTGKSYIKTGYITNNATDTAFDYGGGGLFLVSGGFLRVYSPLVTLNTADGWGGGVAACTNGTVITSDAAIFDNAANQNGYTTNDNEYGDRWATNEFLDLPKGSSSDFFCAKQSEVYDSMLGGGYYNWQGFMSGKAASRAHFHNKAMKSESNSLDIIDSKGNALEPVRFFSSNFETNPAVFSNCDRYAYAYLPEKGSDGIKIDWSELLVGTYATFDGAGYYTDENILPNPLVKTKRNGRILEVKALGNPQYLDGVRYEKYAFRLYSGSVKVSYNTWGEPSANKLSLVNNDGSVQEMKFFSGGSSGDNAYLYLPEPQETTYRDELVGRYVSFEGKGFKATSLPASGWIEDVVKPANSDSVTKQEGNNSVVYSKYVVSIIKSDEDLNEEANYTILDGGSLKDAEGNNIDSDSVSYYKTFLAKLNGVGKSFRYNVYQIHKFPLSGFAGATRFMSLTAHPTTNPIEDPAGTKYANEAKQAAFKEATVFFTGNYSANNGGGIGCNGKIVIGRDPKEGPDPEDPKLPDDKYFNLEINKSWSNLGDLKENQNGTLTAAFKVTVYESKDHYEASTNGDMSIAPVFETVLAMTFDKDSAAEQVRKLENLKEGWYVVVEEIGGQGDNFEIDSSTAQAVMDANMTMKFKNTYKDEGSYSTGVVNSYATETDEDGNSFVSVSQDSLYVKRTTKPETDTPEETEPSTEGTPVGAAN